jgi:hypothetical protein
MTNPKAFEVDSATRVNAFGALAISKICSCDCPTSNVAKKEPPLQYL